MTDRQPTILIIDDLEDNRLSIKLALKREGYLFLEADNGERGVALAIEAQPDVILMDALMPVMDGFDATLALRRNIATQRTPILMITALSERDDKIRALECGVSDFISKPFDKLELTARCKSYVEMSNLNKRYILATRNPLTFLPNKTALLKSIAQCTHPKLILMRIDDYEMIEEFYTETVAQMIEVEFSKIAHELIPCECTRGVIFHIAEGEFAVLIDDVDQTLTSEQAHAVCEALHLNAKDRIITLEEYEYDISVTVSYALDPSNIFEHARVAINHAIKNRKEVIFADDIIHVVHKEATDNIATIKMIRTAIADDKVLPYYQPIYNNRSNTVEKYEALIRLIDHNGSVISPAHFLEISKKGKYYSQLTMALFNRVFDHFSRNDAKVSVNISALDIEDPKTRAFIFDKLNSYPDVAMRLTFELLEDEKVKDFRSISRFISEVKERGCTIAIDDFGSGYSSFERLLDFQPDLIKIDGTLIRNIDSDPYSGHIVETIQDFAQRTGLKTVAEFVGNRQVFEIVRNIGIDFSQGYFIAPPQEQLLTGDINVFQ